MAASPLPEITSALDIITLVDDPLGDEVLSLPGKPGTWVFLSERDRDALQALRGTIISQLKDLEREFSAEFHQFSFSSVDQKVTPPVRRVFLQKIVSHISEVLADRDVNPDVFSFADRNVQVNDVVNTLWLQPVIQYREGLTGKVPKPMWLDRAKWYPSLGSGNVTIEGSAGITSGEDRRIIDGIVRVAVATGKGLKFMDKLSQSALGIRWFMKGTEAERSDFMK
jgi:hypothetical protein